MTSLTEKLESAFISFLADTATHGVNLAALGLPTEQIRRHNEDAGVLDPDIDGHAPPRLVVSAELAQEHIHDTGVWECSVTLTLAANMDAVGRDDFDAIWDGVLAILSWDELAAQLTQRAADFHCHGVLRSGSSTSDFDERTRFRSVTLAAFCMALDEP